MIAPRRHNVMSDRRIRLAEIAPMDGLPWSPRLGVSFGALVRGTVAAILCCVMLYGLFTIGAK